jgi:hypothetical protein
MQRKSLYDVNYEAMKKMEIIKNRENNNRKMSLLSHIPGSKYDYPILEYREKFSSNYQEMKKSLTGINGNITNYKNEISKLEGFLITINEHEKNYDKLQKKYSELKSIIGKSIEIESLIDKLSSNQQIINISEYVNLYADVRRIIDYFRNSQLTDRLDFENNMVKLMRRGFKVYEETFYLLVKRLDNLEFNNSTENEKSNLLNKIRSLAECLEDQQIEYNFSEKLIADRSEKILSKFENFKSIQQKVVTDENYERNSGLITNYLIESEKLFTKEKEYLYDLLSPCDMKLKEVVYSQSIQEPLQKILIGLKELTTKHNKSSIKKLDFYTNLDILNIWHERIALHFKNYVLPFNPGLYENLVVSMKSIEAFCLKFIDETFKDILLLNDKFENENVLKSCNELVFFLSNVLSYETAYDFIKKEFLSSGNNFSIESILDSLIKKLESKSTVLEKKYAPLKYIFLINNIFFIKSKLYQKPFVKYIDKNYADSLENCIKNYLKSYLDASWSKIMEVCFNEKDHRNVLIYEIDGKNLKSSTKELIKKKFATFNECMKINLKFQQHMQIIDPNLEKNMIDANIQFIAQNYEEFYTVLANSGFTKFKNKYVLYMSANDVIQDLKLYFMQDFKKK